MFVTVSDFDDTLFPSHHFMNLIDKADVKFPEISQNIKELITTALGFGPVYIITNATTSWVQKCQVQHLVDCDQIFNQVTIWSTRELGMNIVKTSVFMKLLYLFQTDEIHHLIAMGDSFGDRDAALHMHKILGDKIYVKNIKFINTPSLRHLQQQQMLVKQNFETLRIKAEHMDLMLTILNRT